MSRASKDDVMRFIRAICPEAPDLYLASFDEKRALNDAAEMIERLQREHVEDVDRMERAAIAIENLTEQLNRRAGLETRTSPAFEGSLCEHVPKGYACEICNHDGQP